MCVWGGIIVELCIKKLKLYENNSVSNAREIEFLNAVFVLTLQI